MFYNLQVITKSKFCKVYVWQGPSFIKCKCCSGRLYKVVVLQRMSVMKLYDVQVSQSQHVTDSALYTV